MFAFTVREAWLIGCGWCSHVGEEQVVKQIDFVERMAVAVGTAVVMVVVVVVVAFLSIFALDSVK